MFQSEFAQVYCSAKPDIYQQWFLQVRHGTNDP